MSNHYSIISISKNNIIRLQHPHIQASLVSNSHDFWGQKPASIPSLAQVGTVRTAWDFNQHDMTRNKDIVLLTY